MAGRGGASVEVRYRAAGGEDVVTTWADVDAAVVVGGAPVRSFRWHRGQRNYPGWLWTATTESLVGYENLLERDRLLLADFDSEVAGIASQPFWVSGRDGSRVRRHVPDYLLVGVDGTAVVVDVKPARMCEEPEVAAVLAWTGRLCAERGWRYEVYQGADLVVLANVRFLAGGRRRRFVDQECAQSLRQVAAEGMTLAEAEALVDRDRLDVRAAALSLLWSGVWVMDLSVPLSSGSVLTQVRGG